MPLKWSDDSQTIRGETNRKSPPKTVGRWQHPSEDIGPGGLSCGHCRGEMAGTKSNQETATEQRTISQIIGMVEKLGMTDAWLRPLQPQQGLTEAITDFQQILGDPGCKWVGRIHNPAERSLLLKQRRHRRLTIKGSDPDLIQWNPLVSKGRSFGDNADLDPPPTGRKTAGEGRAFPGATEDPDPMLVITACLHQDGRT